MGEAQFYASRPSAGAAATCALPEIAFEPSMAFESGWKLASPPVAPTVNYLASLQNVAEPAYSAPAYVGPGKYRAPEYRGASSWSDVAPDRVMAYAEQLDFLAPPPTILEPLPTT